MTWTDSFWQAGLATLPRRETQVLPFADVKSLPLYYAFEQSVYQARG
jgi:hypothetical protein